jgi:catechol 2,3-dioxygenase-like lactoylglutathione lyase family enzyme
MTMHIDVLSIPVTDQEISKRFYADALGFEAAMDYQTGPETRWVQLKLPGTQTSIALVTKQQTLPGGMKLGEPGSAQGMTIMTADLADVQRRLSGMSKHSDVHKASWGDFLIVADPDGNSWVIFSPVKTA